MKLDRFKSTPATEIKNRFGDYLGEVIRCKQPAVIKRHGKNVAVLLEFEEWKKLREGSPPEAQHPWILAYKNCEKKIRKRLHGHKSFSAAVLVNSIRDEE